MRTNPEELNMQPSLCVLPRLDLEQGKNMGLTYVTVRIANPADSKRYQDVDFLVDSGAVHTFVPKKILREIGISPDSTRSFLQANGEKIERAAGSADARY